MHVPVKYKVSGLGVGLRYPLPFLLSHSLLVRVFIGIKLTTDLKSNKIDQTKKRLNESLLITMQID
jgi:hypothetical protein